MAVMYPAARKCKIVDDPLALTKWMVQLHNLDGWRLYFWHSALLIKVLILTGRTIYAVQSMHEPNKVAALVATYPIRFMAVVKLTILFTHRKKVAYFHETINSDFWGFHIAGSAIEKRILKRFVYVNLLVYCEWIVSLLVLLFLTIFPLVNMPDGKRPLPNIIWTPFDTDPSPLHEILYVIFIWNLTLSVNGNAFFDGLYIYTSQHLYAQFILLKELLSHLTDDIMEEKTDLEKFTSDQFQERVYARLKLCVEHHVKLLKFGKTIESVTSIPLLPQLVMSYAAFVINGYIMSVDHSDFFKTAILFNLTGAFFVQLSYYALFATDLKVQSLSVIDAINGANWYLFKAPIKRALIFTMLNTEKAINITAGGMANVDNTVLIDVCQKAFSAIALLRALISEKAPKDKVM